MLLESTSAKAVHIRLIKLTYDHKILVKLTLGLPLKLEKPLLFVCLLADKNITTSFWKSHNIFLFFDSPQYYTVF